MLPFCQMSSRSSVVRHRSATSPQLYGAGDGVEAVGVDAVDDRPPGGPQGVAHQREARDLLVAGTAGGTPVVLEVVDAPRGERGGVLRLVPPAARRARIGTAGLRAGAVTRHLVDAELQALAVDVVPEGLHPARELGRVGPQVARPVALRVEPAVVDHHVPVAGLSHARAHHRVGGLADLRLGHSAAEAVPAVPAQRWSERRAAGCGRGGGVDRGREGRGDRQHGGREDTKQSAARSCGHGGFLSMRVLRLSAGRLQTAEDWGHALRIMTRS